MRDCRILKRFHLVVERSWNAAGTRLERKSKARVCSVAALLPRCCRALAAAVKPIKPMSIREWMRKRSIYNIPTRSSCHKIRCAIWDHARNVSEGSSRLDFRVKSRAFETRRMISLFLVLASLPYHDDDLDWCCLPFLHWTNNNNNNALHYKRDEIQERRNCLNYHEYRKGQEARDKGKGRSQEGFGSTRR